MNILIKNGHLIDPKNSQDGVQDVYIVDGKIASIGDAPTDFNAETTIDAKGLTITPGLVDLATRLREPGLAYKATLNSELAAAVAGGVTSLACLPDTEPALDEPSIVEMLKYRAQQLNLAHVYPLGALTTQLAGSTLTEMHQLAAAGCVGFTQADQPISDTQVLWRSFAYAATFGYTLFLRPEDAFLGKNGVAHDGEVATRLGLKGIPAAAEHIRLSTLLTIAEETQANLHIARLSTAKGVDLVRQAKANGAKVTADVSIQHLHFTEMDLGFFDSNMHVRPPLRTQRDQLALCEGVKDGTIDAIVSDHTPVDEDNKVMPFAQAEPGASALELLLPMSMKWAAQHGVDTATLMQRLSSAPAQILNISAGDLSIGAPADIAIIDTNHYEQIDAQQLVSMGKNTPFHGMEAPAKVKYCLVAGELRYQD